MSLDHTSLAVDYERERKRGKPVAHACGQFNCVISTDERRIVELELLGESIHLIRLVDGDAHELETAGTELLLLAHEFWHLAAAWLAPSSPEVDDDDLASPLAERLLGPFRVRQRQGQ